MTNSIVEIKEQLLSALRQLDSNTEEIFLSLGRTFPSLLRALKRDLQNSWELLNSGNENNTDSFVGHLHDLRNYSKKSSLELKKLNKGNEQILTSLAERFASVSQLSQKIRTIQEDSMSMEMVSLNAMTVALKAGSQGKAFSYITEELKRLSNRTILLTDTVSKKGESLNQSFGTFQETLVWLDDSETTILGGFLQDFETTTNEIASFSMKISASFIRLYQSAANIESNLVTMVSLVQRQDRIRQSIEHSLISLNRIETVTYTDDDLAQKLDLLAFYAQLPGLCGAVLNEVKSQLVHCLLGFEECIKKSENDLASLETERTNLLENETELASGNTLLSRFNHALTICRDLALDLQQLSRRKSQSAKESREIERQVKDLNDQFLIFESLCSRFQSIDVASRIEIAKQLVLQEMSGTVEEMTVLTQKINQDVEQCLQITAVFQKDINKLLSAYRKTQLDHEHYSQFLIDDFRSKTSRLERSRKELMDSIRKTGDFSRSFVASFKDARSELTRLGQLIDDVAIAHQQLDNIDTQMKSIFSQSLAEAGLSEWNMKNRQLQEMIERFTIYQHKQAAGLIGGFEVEQGSDAGEVVLF